VSHNLIGSTFAELYHRNLPAKDRLHGVRKLHPAWNHFSDYSAIAAAGLQLRLYKRLRHERQCAGYYLNNPALI